MSIANNLFSGSVDANISKQESGCNQMLNQRSTPEGAKVKQVQHDKGYRTGIN